MSSRSSITGGRPIILCGFMGSGKTTVGRPLAQRLSYQFVDTDQLLVRTFGMDIPEIFRIGGEPHFRDLEHRIARQVSSLKHAVISTGGGMLTFERNSALLAAQGIIVYLRRDFETCYRFLEKRQDRPIVRSRTKQELREIYENRTIKYQRCSAVTIDNDGSIDDAVDAVLKGLRDL